MTTLADLLAMPKLRVTSMTGPMHALTGTLADPILRLDLGRFRQAILPTDLGLLHIRHNHGRAGRVQILGVLGLLDRIARAGLASLVAALHAGLVVSVGRLATMALAMDTHPDRLVDALHTVGRHRRRPFIRLQRQTVFLEEDSSLLLLDRRATERLQRRLLSRLACLGHHRHRRTFRILAGLAFFPLVVLLALHDRLDSAGLGDLSRSDERCSL